MDYFAAPEKLKKAATEKQFATAGEILHAYTDVLDIYIYTCIHIYICIYIYIYTYIRIYSYVCRHIYYMFYRVAKTHRMPCVHMSCLCQLYIFICHLSHKSPIIRDFLAARDLQLQASYASSPCIQGLDDHVFV